MKQPKDWIDDLKFIKNWWCCFECCNYEDMVKDLRESIEKNQPDHKAKIKNLIECYRRAYHKYNPEQKFMLDWFLRDLQSLLPTTKDETTE